MQSTSIQTLEPRTLFSAPAATPTPGHAVAPAAAAVHAPALPTRRTARVHELRGLNTYTEFGADVRCVAIMVNKAGNVIRSGTVTFQFHNPSIPDITVPVSNQGKAFLDTTDVPVGFTTITAHFNGTRTYKPVDSGIISQHVIPASTVTQIAQDDATTASGQPAVFTANVTLITPNGKVPAGRIKFRDGTTFLRSVRLDGRGRAVLTLTDLPAGFHSITATYEGSDEFLRSDSPAVYQMIS